MPPPDAASAALPPQHTEPEPQFALLMHSFEMPWQDPLATQEDAPEMFVIENVVQHVCPVGHVPPTPPEMVAIWPHVKLKPDMASVSSMPESSDCDPESGVELLE